MFGSHWHEGTGWVEEWHCSTPALDNILDPESEEQRIYSKEGGSFCPVPIILGHLLQRIGLISRVMSPKVEGRNFIRVFELATVHFYMKPLKLDHVFG